MKNPILGLLINKIFIMKKLERKELKSFSGSGSKVCNNHLVPGDQLPEEGGYYDCPCNTQVFCRNMGACITVSANGIPDFCEI